MARKKKVEYWIVNPKGAIHKVNKDEAAARLRQAGYRMATAAEIKKAQTPNITYPSGRKVAIQTWDDPIVEPFNPDLEVELEPEGVEVEDEGEAEG